MLEKKVRILALIGSLVFISEVGASQLASEVDVAALPPAGEHPSRFCAGHCRSPQGKVPDVPRGREANERVAAG